MTGFKYTAGDAQVTITVPSIKLKDFDLDTNTRYSHMIDLNLCRVCELHCATGLALACSFVAALVTRHIQKNKKFGTKIVLNFTNVRNNWLFC